MSSSERLSRNADDEVIYAGIDVFTTPVADLVSQLRRHTTVHEDEAGRLYTPPDLRLSFWRPATLSRFVASVLLAGPGHAPTPPA